MDKFVIDGPTPLHGNVSIHGAKNAVLPLMAAALLARGKSVITNVPELRDVATMVRMLDILGAKTTYENGTMTIDTASANGIEAPYDRVRTMRASIYVLGPLLARFGEAKVSLPGGCAWGPRPVNLHLEGLRAMGAQLDIEHGYVVGHGVKLLEQGAEAVGVERRVHEVAVLEDERLEREGHPPAKQREQPAA